MSTDRADEQPMTAACPSCGSAKSLYKRKVKTPTWICHMCGHEFDDPDHRPSKGSRAGNGSPLVDLDAEEVP